MFLLTNSINNNFYSILGPKTKNSIKLIPIEKLTKVFPKLKLLDASFNKGKIDATKIIKTNTPEKNIKQLVN